MIDFLCGHTECGHFLFLRVKKINSSFRGKFFDVKGQKVEKITVWPLTSKIFPLKLELILFTRKNKKCPHSVCPHRKSIFKKIGNIKMCVI